MRRTSRSRSAALVLPLLALALMAPLACKRTEEPNPAPAKSASLANGATNAPSVPAGPTVTASPASASASAFVLPPNGLCPGPCEGRWDDDGDGTIDRAASFSYLPDGRVDHVRSDLDADGIVDRDKEFAYRMPTPQDVLPKGADGAAWKGVLFQLGGRIWIPYDRAVVYELPGVPVTDCESATTSHPEVAKPGDKPILKPAQLSTKTTCESKMLTSYETFDVAGKRVGSARFSYACWPKERGCPVTPALAPIAARTTRTVCRADAELVAATIDPDPHAKPPPAHPMPGTERRSEGHASREASGMRLFDVPKSGAVDRFGLRPADLVTSMAGLALDKRPDGALRKAAATANDIEVTFVRAGTTVTLKVHVGGDCSR